MLAGMEYTAMMARARKKVTVARLNTGFSETYVTRRSGENAAGLRSKKRRHERYFVRAGRPVTQLVNSRSRPGTLSPGSTQNPSPRSDARRDHRAAIYFVSQERKKSASSFPNTVTETTLQHKPSTQFNILLDRFDYFSIP